MSDSTPSAPAGPGTILVGIANPDTIERLMALAAVIARPAGSLIYATHIVTVPVQMALASARSSPQVAASSELLRAAIRVGTEKGVEVKGVVEICRKIAEGLANAARSREADLLLLGYSDLAGDEDPRPGSRYDTLMHRVAREVTCDVVVAKFRNTGVEKVLVPVAPSRNLAPVAMLVHALAQQPGVTVRFLHVLEPESDVAEGRDAALELLERHGREELGELEIATAEDFVDVVVDRCATCDLAIVGAAARPVFSKAIFGDAARKIAEQAPCSVLVARAADR